MSEEFISEINFWSNNVDSFTARVYWESSSLPVEVRFSDLSDSSCGAFFKSDYKLVFHQH